LKKKSKSSQEKKKAAERVGKGNKARKKGTNIEKRRKGKKTIGQKRR